MFSLLEEDWLTLDESESETWIGSKADRKSI